MSHCEKMITLCVTVTKKKLQLDMFNYNTGVPL